MEMRLARLGLRLTLTTAVACGGRSLSGPSNCSVLEPAAVAAVTGDYAYVACDAEGRPLLLGQLALAVETDGTIRGTWEIDRAPGVDRAAEVGPQVGEGEVQGFVQDGHAWLNLNPGWADNNVFLSGVFGPGGIGGSWSWSTLLGPRSGGAFTARRR